MSGRGKGELLLVRDSKSAEIYFVDISQQLLCGHM